MARPAFLPTATAAAVLAAALVLACREPTGEEPPVAEFLISAGDSTFWVRTDEGALRVRRAPLTLAHYDGRFHELYVADDDRSFRDAVLVAQRVYRRDLLSGDSAIVFDEPRVASIARAYAAAHPDEEPLEPDEEASDDPHTVATSEVEILDALGPYLAVEYRVDVEIASGEDSHTARRRMVDLRDGAIASLPTLLGDAEAARVAAAGRRAYRVVLDSVKRGHGRVARRAARAIDAFRFDSTSFSIHDIDGAPMVAFHVPGRGDAVGGMTLTLPHIRAAAPGWWRSIAPTLPKLAPDSASEVWSGARYDVVARYDTAGDHVTLVVRDSTRREWPAARLPVPARRVYRLDGPAVDSASRRALARAFDESSLYSGQARTVMIPRAEPPRVVDASWRPPAKRNIRRSPRPTPARFAAR